MILFLSDGRLGNQIFQYAFLNTIRKENERVLAFNMDQFQKVFQTGNPYFHFINLPRFHYLLIKKIFIPYFLNFLSSLRIISFIQEEQTNDIHHPRFIQKKGLLPITFVQTGFFQSEHFFDPRKLDFRFHPHIVNKAIEFLQQIPSHYEIAFVHVRRGDYLNETYEGIRGIQLPASYYRDAIQILKEDQKELFFVFLSDDPEFVECCFKDITPKIISLNSAEVDLAIMSLCTYGVVSNSSFSWWGAYLMKKRKKVIFPKYWYGWKIKKQSHIGIYPDWATVIEVKIS